MGGSHSAVAGTIADQAVGTDSAAVGALEAAIDVKTRGAHLALSRLIAVSTVGRAG